MFSSRIHGPTEGKGIERSVLLTRNGTTPGSEHTVLPKQREYNRLLHEHQEYGRLYSVRCGRTDGSTYREAVRHTLGARVERTVLAREII